MIRKENLRVIQRQSSAGGSTGDLQMFHATHAAMFVAGWRLELAGKFFARPLFELTLVHKLDPGIGRERLADEVAVTGSMRAKIQLDRISRSVLRFCDYARQQKHSNR